LESPNLRDARANEYTLWPAGFDWQSAGVIKVSELFPTWQDELYRGRRVITTNE